MKFIKKILRTFAKIIHFRPFTEEERIEYSKRYSSESYSKSNDTKINPANGLPMLGCLDVNGNTFGTNNSYNDYHRNNDLYRTNSFVNYSSYDSFNNRLYIIKLILTNS